MKRLTRYGLHLFMAFLISLAITMLVAQPLFATGEAEAEETESDSFEAKKKAAIEAANEAIDKLPVPEHIVQAEQLAVRDVLAARVLVDIAREAYGATDSDFPRLSRLLDAESVTYKLLAIKDAKDAIDKIPPLAEITEEDRILIEEARRLIEIAKNVYLATSFELCWRLYYLADAEEVLADLPEPEPEPEPEPVPPPEPDPLPPTGALSASIAAGAFLTGTGLFFIIKRRNRLY